MVEPESGVPRRSLARLDCDTVRPLDSIVKPSDGRANRGVPIDQDETTDPLADGVAAIRDLNLAATAFRHALAAHYNVGVTDTHAMSYLAAYGPLGQAELAQRLSMSTSAVTSLLDRLEAAGVVARHAHPSDRRRIEVAVTDAGMRAVTDTRRRAQQVVAGVDPAELTIANRVMRELAEGLRAAARDLSSSQGVIG